MDIELQGVSQRKWHEFYSSMDAALKFPDENLVRIFKGNRWGIPQTGRLLDHGFGSGNNLKFFHDQGYSCYGVEVSAASVELFKSTNMDISNAVHLHVMENLSLPYEENFFDVVVSWNAIHYAGTLEKFRYVVDELHRVIKPGGKILLSTITPDHVLIKNSDYLGENCYRVHSNYATSSDNRSGIELVVFQDKKKLSQEFKSFKGIQTGEIYHDLFCEGESYATHMVLGTK